MNKKRFGDVQVLTASMSASMVEAIESACTARGMSRSAWLRAVLTPILEDVDTDHWGADEAMEILGDEDLEEDDDDDDDD